MPHQPALAQAFRDGPLGRLAARRSTQIWARAEQRGEVRPGLAGSVVAETTSALLVQRWLLTGRAGGRRLRRRGARDRGPAAGALGLPAAARRPRRERRLRLPAERAGLALERADHVVGDPAAVEAAGLRPGRLAVDEGAVDPAGIERDRAAQVLEARARVLVGPGRLRRRAGRRRRRPSRWPRPSTRTSEPPRRARGRRRRRRRAGRSRPAGGWSRRRGRRGGCRRSTRPPTSTTTCRAVTSADGGRG